VHRHWLHLRRRRTVSVATRFVPVAVRSGVISEVDVDLTGGRGCRRRFEIVAPIALTGRDLRVFQGDQLVAAAAIAGIRPGRLPAVLTEWLAPGDYTVTVEGNGYAGRTRFTVREGTDETVRITLQ